MWVIVRWAYPQRTLIPEIFQSSESANAYMKYLYTIEMDKEVDFFVFKLVDLSGR
jgi:hypothetical protein